MKRLFSRICAASHSSRKPAPSHRRGLRIEALEDRRMLTPVYFHDGHETIGGGFVTTENYYPDWVGIHIVGSEGNDTVRVTEANGQIEVFFQYEGTQGGRYWFPSADVPRIFFDGYGGNDVYNSTSATTSFIDGGAGNDTLMGGVGEVHIFGGAGDDTISAGYTSYGEFYGGANNDTIYGTRMADTLNGEGGNDTLYGFGGNDNLYGGSGHDTLWGGEDNDFLAGGTGNDKLYGEEGNDILWGGSTTNTTFVDEDSLFGGRGYDTLYGGNGPDYLDGGSDGIADYIAGEGGADVLRVNVDATNAPEDYYADYNEGEGDRFGGFGPDDLLTTDGRGAFAPSLRGGFGAAAVADAFGEMFAPSITERYIATPYEEALDFSTLTETLSAALLPESLELWTVTETTLADAEQAQARFEDFLSSVDPQAAYVVDEGVLSFLDDAFGWLGAIDESTVVDPDGAFSQLPEDYLGGLDLDWVSDVVNEAAPDYGYDPAGPAEAEDYADLSGLADAYNVFDGYGEPADESLPFDAADQFTELTASDAAWDLDLLAAPDPGVEEAGAGYDLDAVATGVDYQHSSPSVDPFASGWGNLSAAVNPATYVGSVAPVWRW